MRRATKNAKTRRSLQRVENEVYSILDRLHKVQCEYQLSAVDVRVEVICTLLAEIAKSYRRHGYKAAIERIIDDLTELSIEVDMSRGRF